MSTNVFDVTKEIGDRSSGVVGAGFSESSPILNKLQSCPSNQGVDFETFGIKSLRERTAEERSQSVSRRPRRHSRDPAGYAFDDSGW